MLAHHPITGKPIRIMKTETHLYKNKKSMAWLRSSPDNYANPFRMCRWNTLVTNVTLAEEWFGVFKAYPSAILLTDVNEETLEWLRKKAPKKYQLLFVSKKLMDAYGLEEFQKQKFVNVLCMEELCEMYPHIFHTYKQDEDITFTVLSIAAVFRTFFLFGFTEEELSNSLLTMYRTQLHEAYGLTVGGHSEPEPLWLIQQYYLPTQTKRAKEIRKCLEKNLENPFIDTILLLNENDLTESLPKHPKIVQKVLGRRMSYADVFRAIQVHVPEATIVVFSNSDIYLDFTWRQIWSLNLENIFLSLLRYEEPVSSHVEPALFGPRPDSQDTWVVYSDSVKSRTWNMEALTFDFGRAGCDNAINVEMLRMKFTVANPSLTFRTLHCHSSAVRNYDPKDAVDKPIYMHLEPTGLHDLEPKKDLKPYEKTWGVGESFPRRINSANPQSLKTFCSMVTREQESILLSSESENIYVPSKSNRHVYTFQNAFTTPNGLVYGYNSIYMGEMDSMKKEWATTSISHMTPSLGIKSVLAVPLSDLDSSDLFSYLQNYLARVFRLKLQGYDGDFWMPRDTPRIQDFLQYFKWKEQSMPVIPRDNNVVVYSQEASLLTPSQSVLYEKEDIEALRTQLRPYIDVPKNPWNVVLIQDDTFFTEEDIRAMEEALDKKEYGVSVVYPSRSTPSYILSRMLGASICITGPYQEKLFWMLPRGARVIEVQSELKISGEGAHTAGAASLEYWIVLLARAKSDARRKYLVEQILKTLDSNSNFFLEKESLRTKPTILLPKDPKGIHEHSGDSFREMLGLWFEKGYIELEHTDSPYVWAGKVGDILLYDRPSYEWLYDTPVTYKRIFCGNPKASDIPRGVSWGFWPRRPILVEQRVEAGLPAYEERTDTLVFYGKVENKRQELHRTNNLHEACDKFSMPSGKTSEYMYSQEEYLDKLAQAKYGLCMTGFGLKCNREIECMALGTVPVVAPDVDMNEYANPPKEGVHYIRAKSWNPEELKAQIAEQTKESWMNMSNAAHLWWKINCSSEGLWNLTHSLLNRCLK